MSTTALIKELKEAGQDFELYPTSPEMIKAIWEHRKANYSSETSRNFGDVLDIGCGTCNFKKHVDKFNKPLIEYYEDGSIKSSYKAVNIHNYYVIEKSKILIDKLDADTIVLGTDFQQTTLIDKKVDTIFCNPPYSEYEDWTVKIIKESVCKSIYLIIPQRWKNSEAIKIALDKYVRTPYNRYTNTFKDKDKATVIGSFDFLDAERSARAKVDIVYIDKSSNKEDSAFDTFFEETFGMKEKKGNLYDYECKKEKTKKEELKQELATGRNKIEILVNGYNDALNTLFNHLKVFSELEPDILKTIGVHADNVKSALESNIKGLKSLYWSAAFDCLEEITNRLTTKSRSDMLYRFSVLKTADFTASNIYALIVWVIKNSNKYYTSQMVDLFMALSRPENVRNYKSNQRVFEKDGWGYRNKKHDHYTLDYRIICTQYALPGDSNDYSYDRGLKRQMSYKISDICTVANNLGFSHGDIEFPADWGKKGYVYMADNKTVLFEFKCYLNNNVHIKLNKEFIKALNVVVAKELGWIHSKEDIAKEFPEEIAKGAEQYWDKTLKISVDNVKMLAGGE